MDPGPQHRGFEISLAWRRAGAEICGQITGYLLHPGRGSFPATARSAQKFLGHSGFCQKFFRFFKFRPENFWIFQLSTGNFSALELSGQKNPGSRIFSASVPGAIGSAGIYAGSCAP